jgi:hypothetical protein
MRKSAVLKQVPLEKQKCARLKIHIRKVEKYIALKLGYKRFVFEPNRHLNALDSLHGLPRQILFRCCGLAIA